MVDAVACFHWHPSLKNGMDGALVWGLGLASIAGV